MHLKVGIVMDPIANITYKKDTSLAMLIAAQERGWELYYSDGVDARTGSRLQPGHLVQHGRGQRSPIGGA